MSNKVNEVKVAEPLRKDYTLPGSPVEEPDFVKTIHPEAAGSQKRALSPSVHMRIQHDFSEKRDETQFENKGQSRKNAGETNRPQGPHTPEIKTALEDSSDLLPISYK
ncbi:MAG: hypothetical protein LBI69_02055 [Puniceicoccales bacterium]|jgi:hypothetical protein|nr:hypothetical protein [Puniceicoccales bacterium]